jgi:hypothetical protein
MASKPHPLSATTSSEPPVHHEPPSLADRFVKSEPDEPAEKEESQVKGPTETEGKKEPEEKKEDAEVENMVLTPDEEARA